MSPPSPAGWMAITKVTPFRCRSRIRTATITHASTPPAAGAKCRGHHPPPPEVPGASSQKPSAPTVVYRLSACSAQTTRGMWDQQGCPGTQGEQQAISAKEPVLRQEKAQGVWQSRGEPWVRPGKATWRPWIHGLKARAIQQGVSLY